MTNRKSLLDKRQFFSRRDQVAIEAFNIEALDRFTVISTPVTAAHGR
jgi:hypothetical protein